MEITEDDKNGLEWLHNFPEVGTIYTPFYQ